MARARKDNIFTEPRSSYKPRIPPLERRLRQLEKLQRIQRGADPALLIDPQNINAHQNLEQDLHQESVRGPDGNNEHPDDNDVEMNSGDWRQKCWKG
ncbi:hypothetical protein PGT21_030877 [Puccinia graminis f. sp. tritici]|uniref:Uncharacterized protein n=1 Tax=Puccinia graminis f. sp. tritici TaxID=56615 RepID=A0A5B0PVF6_PUCGR|nr:hypothetical protein PGTUg99_003697 [Puccinia graminis f. sp. tritici]KAA1104740.1 hypothetical protein PGT21_030877 [Puccinia graminis f. sp. tritici]